MRAFIALALPPELKERLGTLINELKTEGIEGRWASPEHIHLTLKFLGNIGDESIEAVGHLLEELGGHVAPFNIVIEGLGAFPYPSKPRVLWVGVREEYQALSHTQKWLEEHLAPLGFPKEEKTFRPHLTLARFKIPSEAVRRRVHQACREREKTKWGQMRVTSIILYESILSPKGAQYRRVKEAELRGFNRI